MAAAAGTATPQRPLPGAFFNTSAPGNALGSTIFANNISQLQKNPQPPPSDSGAVSTPAQTRQSEAEKAAKAINETLATEARFPSLEKNVSQGISGAYSLPTQAAWAPFQRLKQHELPARILEQANMAGLNMKVGVFGPLGHAWVILDQSLYLWDYTLPNPELIGWEENAAPITAVKLIKPKVGVFVKEIEHLIVVVTTNDMTLLGVALQNTETGAKTVALYNTRMSISVNRLNVQHVEAAKNTGRIFFTGDQSDDIYEFQYSQDEGWFRGRTNRICHTRSGISFVQDNMIGVGQFFRSNEPRKLINQMVIDDTRDLMYTLSNNNVIKIWLLRQELVEAISRPLMSLIQNTSNLTPRSDLLTSRDVRAVSISPIPATESRMLGLMATTNTGCRLYLTVVRGFDSASAQSPPNSMQVSHIRFPPRDPRAAPTQPNQTAVVQQGNPSDNVDVSSMYLTPTTHSERFPPGYFVAFLPYETPGGKLFCAAPDVALLKNIADVTPVNTRFQESGTMFELSGDVCEVVPITGVGGAATTPDGFGNELAVQFDKPSAEIAIITNNSIQTVRRRRLVDIFASILRTGANDEETRDNEVSRWVRQYGRIEVTATALAVACGQGMDVTSDSRLSSVTDPEILEAARSAFVTHGGRPEYNANVMPGPNDSPTDAVTPSPRHSGTTLFLSRLIRSVWTVKIIQKEVTPVGGVKQVPGVKLEKLRNVQRDLNALAEFLARVKTSIKELSEGAALSGARSRKEEVEIRAEQEAFRGLVQLISSIVEGISFALVLFGEDVEQILATLGEESRAKALSLTFEELFVSSAGKELAKELVKAIVNRSIANGSNVDTIADSLRRRCGSFCSADDVVIFKAQEQVKRASEAGSQSEGGRMLLNESQRLFKKVAVSLSMENLHLAVDQYVQMQYYAGAIELCLEVAAQKDKARQALGWLRDGMSEDDDRKPAFDKRKRCYDLAFATIKALDEHMNEAPEQMDGQTTLAMKRRSEAYRIVNASEDAVFQMCLYDWYVSEDQADRLLEIDSTYVREYLKKRSQEDRAHADLLWKYFAHRNDFLQAASVQLDLARGFFDLSLEERIGYLSRARANANTRQTLLQDSRQSKQQLLREVSDLLEVANIQDDILQRMKVDKRLSGTRREEVLATLDGPILALDELFNQYADQASYHDICLLIYSIADHRNPVDIKTTWQNLLNAAINEDRIVDNSAIEGLPWELVGQRVREIGRRLEGNDATFPLHDLVPLLEKFKHRALRSEPRPPASWVLDIFVELEVPFETLLPVFEQMYYSHEEPFDKAHRRVELASEMMDLLDRWYSDSERRGERIAYGSEESAIAVQEIVVTLLRGDLDQGARYIGQRLIAGIEKSLR